jgi:heptosyltransferase III
MRRLLIRPGGIGDCLTSLPVMEQLRAGYTEVWVPSAVVPLVQFADRARSIAETGLDLLGLDESQPPPQPLCAALAQFDSIVSWYGSNRAEFRAAAEKIHGGWRFLPALPPADSLLQATDFHALNAGVAMGLIPRLRLQAEPRRSVVIHPFSGGLRKNWPLERFRLLAEKLPVPVEWTAGPEEELPEAHRFDDLAALANWISGALFYVGNDSGITHLAAATGIPTIALFGASSARVWRPRGENVTVIEGGSMEQIGADDVLIAARRLAGAARRE